ncbi:AMP-binding enzyme domain-containing protein [Ditylenchus destructor]|nr:AMP-binding enzyme domain-containing protein [Ditylenchus destructor]
MSLISGLYITQRYGDFIYRSYLTLERDLRGLALLIRVKLDLSRRWRENRGIHDIFLDIVQKSPDRICAVDVASGREFTFREFNELCNCFANHFQSLGYVEGDVVAIFMENSVEFVAAWMGLSKIGVITAWVNSNLKLQPLSHCIRTSQAKAIICSDTLSTVLRGTRTAGFLEDYNLEEFVCSEKSANSNLFQLFNAEEGYHERRREPCRPSSNVNFKSILCFIYTSGTTGLPKAALMKHFRYYSMVMGSAESFGIRPEDRVYISMPLYHTSAGILGVGQMLLRGTSCVIRQKFSASNFWKDCVKYNCTVSQYIGEICRYLLAQPVIDEERLHQVRLLYGNGLRAEIWQEFVDRFCVKVGELYGSTEGTSSLVNIDGKVGSCGFLPISPLTSRLHPVRLVKIDDVNGEVLRRPNGLCIACKPGETGAMVSTIRKNNPLLVFEGYLNKSETSKKVIHDVFRHGDSAFLTGDILHWDRLGYVYFKDRTGDTFRWKGENVSTTEVEAVMMPLKSVIDVTVYGVEIPGMEGRAGMAAVVKDEESGQSTEQFLTDLTKLLTTQLPSYAIPVFIRLCNSVDRTGTFKLVKTNLQRLGYRCADSQSPHFGDLLHIWDPKARSYSLFDDTKRCAFEKGDISKTL